MATITGDERNKLRGWIASKWGLNGDRLKKEVINWVSMFEKSNRDVDSFLSNMPTG